MITLTKQKPPLEIGDTWLRIPHSEDQAINFRDHKPGWLKRGRNRDERLEQDAPMFEVVRVHPCGALECRRIKE
jgi:hypothetical protein